MTPEIALQWIVDNPGAHPANMVAVAREGLESVTMANGLTRAETEATLSCAGLTVKPWTKHEGGKRPVASFETVEVQFRNDSTEIDRAHEFYWNHYFDGDDIVAYRVL